jgi:cytoskeleton protein RodZ
MSEDNKPEQGELEILRAGDRLRMARESAGLTLADIASRTRITQRHLDAIERSDFDLLPGRTYVTGFARSYARAVELPEAEIAREIRAELDGGAMRPRETYEAYEPADPARVPSRRVAWTVLGAIAILAAAYAVWRTLALDGSTVAEAPEKAAIAATGSKQATIAPTAVPANTSVVLQGLEQVWIGFDDASGKTENWRTLEAGETLTVPVEYIEQFTLRTAKPQMLKVSVGGRDVGLIGPADTLVKNVSLKPADLLARATAAAPSTSTAAPAP